MQPADAAPSEPLQAAEQLLIQQCRLALQQRQQGGPGAERAARLLRTMQESLALMRETSRLIGELKAQAGAAQASSVLGVDADALPLGPAPAPPPALHPAFEALERARLVEEERRRIARELHDTVGQQLCALRLTVADLQSATSGALLGKRLALLTRLAEAADMELDRAVFSLHPPALAQRDLVDAASGHVADWSRLFGVPVDFFAIGLEKRQLPQPVVATVYRVLQEALTNIAKHAHATRVSVALSARDGQLSLCVEDDGSGFVPEATPGHRLGLRGMRERIAALGGRLELESAPGQVATLLVHIPLQPRPTAGTPRRLPATTAGEVAGG
ncbi:sensor histidine kinase [Azohydromonas lata]|uniref:sensor histidine kinase n=1 Tax=Azohydromonas lata TaxID=45677 RepID=UPI000A021652|nr:ATP-binding protein [Azohydromonas lata]